MRLESKDYAVLLRTGAVRTIRVGADESSLVSAFGVPEEIDEGMAGTRRLSFANRHLQVTLLGDRVVHLGLYFGYHSPDVLIDGLLLSRATQAEELFAWTQALGIAGERRGARDAPRLELGNGVIAVFDATGLDSLQISQSA